MSQWKLLRMEGGEAGLLKDDGPEGQLRLLERFWKAQRREERAFATAQRKLEQLQNSQPRRAA